MQEPIKFVYTFDLDDGETSRFEILLERTTLALVSNREPDLPSWTELGFHMCSNCTLDEGSNPHCPVAANLVGIVEEFKALISYDKVKVTVETEDRTYLKDTTVNQGLGSMLGIVMVTSGCPLMEYLKPMVRFHLPFATVEETIFRMASMYLVAQYILEQEGRPSDRSLHGLAGIYAEVSKVNKDFSHRLAQAAERDANVSALVELDVFASMVQLFVEDAVHDLKPYFSAYVK